MTARRHYFLSNDLDDLERMEQELEAAGIETPQIHALSEQDAQVQHHPRLHEVQSVMKTDVVHSMRRGLLIGLAAAAGVLTGAYLTGLTATAAGWLPFLFLAAAVLSFIVWEAGLTGIQRRNHHFARFRHVLGAGKHVFFVDLEPTQEPVLSSVASAHPRVKPAGTEPVEQHWAGVLQQRFMRVVRNF